MSRSRHYIIGTAGHVDHGKTALIKALTGVETDRLLEERRRGISIELGFARLDLGNGQVAGVVDVPGHEKFIPQMLSGITGIDLVLLVVDINEGVMPQTQEHLQIMQLLKLKNGILVLSKCDLAEPDWLDIVEEEVREQTIGTFLEHAPCCRVSAVTGCGIETLMTTIRHQLSHVEERDAGGAVRLPVDRSFSLSGFGTVVTGTLASGSIRTGDSLELLPAGVLVRVREAQVHDQQIAQVYAGQRVALNLAGVSRNQVTRGSVLGTPGLFWASSRIDVQLQLLDQVVRPLKFRDPVHFHLGTGRSVARVILLEQDALAAGESALVQLSLDQPLMVQRGDRFVIRSYSPMVTIGGGIVIDAQPQKHKRFRPEVSHRLQQLVSGDLGFWLQKLELLQIARVKELEKSTGTGREQLLHGLVQLQSQNLVAQLGDQWLTRERLRSWKQRLPQLVDSYHQQNPLRHGIPRATLQMQLGEKLAGKGFDELVQWAIAEGLLVLRRDQLAAPDWSPQPNAEQQQILARIQEHFRTAGLQVKNNQEVLLQLQLEQRDADEYFLWLYAEGVLVRLNRESAVHQIAYQQAEALLVEHFRHQQFLTLAQFRDLLGSGRKLTQALLESFDARKLTRRDGDHRSAWQLPDQS